MYLKVLTIKPHHTIESISVQFVCATPSQSLHGEERTSGEGAQAGQEVHSYVGPAGVGLL